MIEETKKSIQSILYQRVSSPFYGTLIVSWLIWNWKIIYLTIFVSEVFFKESKIDFITKNYSDINHLAWLPLTSTIILLTVFPFITNGAYWLDILFNNWRENKKNTVENKKLLTIAQSINLREQIIHMEKKVDSLLADKNTEIEQMKLIIRNHTKTESKNENVDNIKDDNKSSDIRRFVQTIKDNEKLKIAFKTINNYIIGGYTGLIKAEEVGPEILGYYLSNDLIEKNSDRTYKWTENGKEVSKIILNESFAFI
jgi:YesN/AraC family two-component response regulator